MAPSVKDGSESIRRKSMSLLSRPLAGLTQINTDVGQDGNIDGTKDKKKSRKRASILPKGFGNSAGSDNTDGAFSPTSALGSSQPRIRPRTLQKNRPSSLFGSLGRRSMNNVEEDGEMENLAGSTPDSPMVDGLAVESPFETSLAPSPNAVRHHGEVQTTSGMFRKKKEYLVLTDTHLIRFKSQSRASEVFPSIRPSFGRSGTIRHPSTTSVGSLHEVQSIHSHASAEADNRIPLEQIVSSYRVEDGRPFFTAEVVWLDEKYHGTGSIQLILHDPEEADLWLSSIRGAAQKARLLQEEPYSQRVIQYLAGIVDAANDYDTDHFQIFRVVRRQTATKGKSSSDDLHKVGSSVCYMVIGRYNVHLIPVPDFSDANGRLLIPKARRQSWGILTLYSMNINNKGEDDRFELGFRMPLQDLTVIDLAAFANPDIVIALYRAWKYLKPLWSDWTFLWNGAESQLRSGEAVMDYETDDWFERTLVGYCIAYGCNPSNIQYAIDLECEDSPQFKLYPPVSTATYSLYELLSIMRALRYHEDFRSISFSNVNLHNLHGVHDMATDHMAHTSSDGRDISRYTINPIPRSLLYREVQAIALKSKNLSRLDFANCLPKRRPKDTYDLETGVVVDKDPGCEVVGAVLALCKEQLTNVNWIVLNGIELGETDLEEMLPALNKRRSNIRAIELSRCGLSDRGIVQLLGHMERQNATIECVNISDNSGRIDLERFSASMTRFSRIRRLDISRITRTSGDKPLIATEVLKSWQLEEFIMNGVPINVETLNSIAAYLKSPMSDKLRVLQMDQCNLNGSQVAVLMRAMTRSPGEARELQLHVSANRFERGVGDIAAAIKDNCTPSTIVARMIEFEKEDHFRELLHALRTNKTIRCLDISKASLPYDANEQTCDALRLVFAENITLEDLDISGEQAHLEVARFGIGLNDALTGLKENTTLKVLRIEYQNLGLEGANTLASVLETNTGLIQIFCEHNEINLQGFTTLVNALAKNYTVLNLPFMQDDQSVSMKRLSVSMRETQQQERRERHVKNSVGRTLTKLGVNHKAKPREDMTTQDLDEVVRLLGERWSKEIERMLVFLQRNNRIANGEDGESPDGEAAVDESILRPTTALSDRGILEQVLSNTTPRADLPNPVDEHVSSKLNSLTVTETALKKDERNSLVSGRTSTDDDTTMTKLDSKDLLSLPNIPRGKMFDLDGEGMFDMDKEEE